ncbi:MAG TPA: anaerobic ribonucleoside-triphosphate reductase, partial [Clostridiales bacterium]|nr:anaerobic ribonucleoside-triphosphate reductase [Clostridiales bacterium]
HFSTIGLVGMNEACLNANWVRANLTDEMAQQFTKDVLNHMRERLSDYQEKYGDLYNLEASPAESTSYRLAKHDVDRYPDIITAAEPGGTPYYTNSSHLPVGFTEDIFEALDIQDELQTLYTSGTVFHAFLGEKLPGWQAAAALVKKIAENYKLPYYTLSPTYSVCRTHGYLEGEQFECPECGEKTEVYSRITGYYRPVQNWNDGKAQEFKDRKLYDIPSSKLKTEGRAPRTAEASQTATNCNDDSILLFATKTCPNCKIAAALLDKAGIHYEKLYVEDNGQKAKDLGLKQAPALLVTKEGKTDRYLNVSEIKRYLGA